MNRSEVKIALIQMRKDEEMRGNEQQCVLRSGNLRPEQLVVIDALAEPVRSELLQKVHGVVIGATGDFSVLKTMHEPWMIALQNLLKAARSEQYPLLGICFGAQLMGTVFGGELITDIENQELGTYEMELTDAAKDDPLFFDMPQRFFAQQGHNQRVSKLPPEAVLLAKSERCPIQAFTWPGSNAYAMQLHPDLDKFKFKARVDHYQDNYLHDADAQAQFAAIKTNLKQTPEAETLVAKFIDRVVIPYWEDRSA